MSLEHPLMRIHQVLGVKLYSVVPNSMAEERTVFTFTKLNSAERAAQKADTIVNIAKVKQHNQCACIISHYLSFFSWCIFKTRSRPVVRFCDISKYVKDTDRQAGSMKTATDSSDAIVSRPASSSTKPLLAEPTEDSPSEAGENKELDRLWEDDEEERERENPVLKFACETASSTAMNVEVNDGVDVGVPQLRDYLGDHPAMSPPVDVWEGPNATKKVACSSAPRVFEVRDAMFYDK